MRTKDKYDEAVEYLTANPEKIPIMWVRANIEKHGCLFYTASQRPNDQSDSFPQRPDGERCGCLTTIRDNGVSTNPNGNHYPTLAWTDELTEAIRADERIPKGPEKITVESLPVFAEWQRRLDKELNRV